MSKDRTRLLITLALLVAAQVVLSRFCSINAWNLKLGFGFLPVAVAGILCGPLPAALVGLLSDLLGATLFPSGPYFPGFTLTAALSGLTYGLLLHKKQDLPHILAASAVAQLILGLLVNTFWIALLYSSDYFLLLSTRLVQYAVMLPVECILLNWVARPLVSALEKGGRI